MRRSFLVVLILLTFVLVAAAALLLLQRQALPPPVITTVPGSTGEVPRVTVEELRAQLATSRPPLVWDLRPTSTFAEGHIPGSRVLTLDAIRDAAAHLNRELPIVTVCA